MPPPRDILTDDLRQLLSRGEITREQVSSSTATAFQKLEKQQLKSSKRDAPTTPGPMSLEPAVKAALRKHYPKGLKGKSLAEARRKVRKHLKDHCDVRSVNDKTLRRHGVRKPKG
jgi:hypothetical protein